MNDASLPAQHTRSQHLYWILQIARWGIYTLVRIIGAATVLKLPWGKSVLELAIFGALGLAISHWLRDFVRRHKWAAATNDEGWRSATDVLERFGSAARGDRIYRAGHALGQLLRNRVPMRLLHVGGLSQTPVPCARDAV